MRKIASWIEDAGVVALRWDDTTVFKPGDFVFDRLAEHAQLVDGAILIFTGDDRVWYRDDKVSQPRDNVLLEYGLFSAALGRKRAIVCRSEDPRVPTDLDGIVRVQIRPNDGGLAKRVLQSWARELPLRIAERYAASPDEIKVLVRYWTSKHVDESSMTERLIGLGVPAAVIDLFLPRRRPTPKAAP